MAGNTLVLQTRFDNAMNIHKMLRGSTLTSSCSMLTSQFFEFCSDGIVVSVWQRPHQCPISEVNRTCTATRTNVGRWLWKKLMRVCSSVNRKDFSWLPNPAHCQASFGSTSDKVEPGPGVGCWQILHIGKYVASAVLESDSSSAANHRSLLVIVASGSTLIWSSLLFSWSD